MEFTDTFSSLLQVRETDEHGPLLMIGPHPLLLVSAASAVLFTRAWGREPKVATQPRVMTIGGSGAQ